jgi:hypothetical protein
LDRDGQNLYVVDNNSYTSRIQVFSSAGVFVRKWGINNPASGIGLSGEGDVTRPAGYAYVAKPGNLGIFKYRPSDGLQRTHFGDPNGHTNEPGLLTDTRHLAVDRHHPSDTISEHRYRSA